MMIFDEIQAGAPETNENLVKFGEHFYKFKYQGSRIYML